MAEFENPSPTAKILADGTLQLEILALTRLGLTARWDAIAKAIMGVASLLGVVLTYPWFKRYFDTVATKKTERSNGRRRSG